MAFTESYNRCDWEELRDHKNNDINESFEGSWLCLLWRQRQTHSLQE